MTPLFFGFTIATSCKFGVTPYYFENKPASVTSASKPKRNKVSMKSLVIDRRNVLFSFFTLILLVALIGCNHAIPRFGVGGRYEEGRDQFFRGKGGDMDRAVEALEYVVSRDPLYKDSLTYLGRAYYRKGRYQDAFAILQRAVALNKDNEVAWIALGLTQMRLGQTRREWIRLRAASPWRIRRWWRDTTITKIGTAGAWSVARCGALPFFWLKVRRKKTISSRPMTGF